MHVQVVNFQLKGATEEQFRAECDNLAPAFAAIPGLISKVWLADGASNTYGGVYTWNDRAAMQAYLASDLFAAVKSHPAFSGVTSRDYGVIEGPTSVTRGLAEVAV
jgi:quinol monooxygenase YgiN